MSDTDIDRDPSHDIDKSEWRNSACWIPNPLIKGLRPRGTKKPDHTPSFMWECCECGHQNISNNNGGYDEYCRGKDHTAAAEAGRKIAAHRRCQRCTIWLEGSRHKNPIMFANGRDYFDLGKWHEPRYKGPGPHWF